MSDVLRKLELEQELRHQRVRAMLSDKPQALAEYDAGMEEIRSGRAQLRNLWHSLSPTQRRVVRMMGEGGASLWRLSMQPTVYFCRLSINAVAKVRAPTVRALVAHNVLAFTGTDGADDRASLTGRGHALLDVLRVTQ